MKKENVRRVLFTGLMCGLFFPLSAQINFRDISFDEALKAAKAENKMVFIDCYTSWCGPCKRLARDIFPTKEAGDYFTPRFVSIKVDMEKGEGPQLGKRYDVGAYPTLLFLNADGELVYRLCGGKSSAVELIKDVEQGIKNQSLTAMQRQYEEGNRTQAFITDYLEMLDNQAMLSEINKVATDFLQNKIEGLFLDKTLYQLFVQYICLPSNSVFQKVYAQKERVKDVYGEAVLEHLEDAWMEYPGRALMKKENHKVVGIDEEGMKEYVLLMEKYNVPSRVYVEACYRMEAALCEKNVNKAVAFAKTYSDYGKVNDNSLLRVFLLALTSGSLGEEQKNILLGIAGKRMPILKNTKDTSGRTITTKERTMTWPEYYVECYAEYLEKL